MGAGLDMALTCDFRFAAAEAKFRCAYTWVGFNPDAGGTWLMPRLMGLEAAKRFAFTGDIWSAEQARASGLVTEVHATADLEAATMAFARQLVLTEPDREKLEADGGRRRPFARRPAQGQTGRGQDLRRHRRS